MEYNIPDIRIKIYDKQDYENNVIANDLMTSNDVIYIPSVFENDIYKKLKQEIKSIDKNKKLFKLWHKNSHYIADDRYNNGKWKHDSETFNTIIENISKAFGVTPEATRLNWYYGGYRGNNGSSESKYYHYDRAAKVPVAQNVTIALSFGATREIGFKHTRRKSGPSSKFKHFKEGHITHLVCKSGSIYAFTRDVNVEHQHAVLPVKENITDESNDRISIVIWGVRNNLCVKDSRISKFDIPSMEELDCRYHNKKYKKNK